MATALRSLTLLLLLLASCNGDDGQELFSRAEQYFASGQFIQAEQSYEQFLQSRQSGPLRWQAWNRLLLIADKVRKHPDRTIDILQSMFLEFEDDAARSIEVLHRMAEVYRIGLNQPDKAYDVWERSLEFCREVGGACFDAHWNMAVVTMETGRMEQAREHYATCLELASEPGAKAATLYALAKLNLVNGDQNKALDNLNTLQRLPGEIKTHRPLAIFMAADIHAQNNRIDTARQLLESIRRTHPNPRLVELRLQQVGRMKAAGNATEER